MKLELIPVPVADPDGNTLTLQEMSWRTGWLGHLHFDASAEVTLCLQDAKKD
ncbi:MAG: hypothetical protein IPO44_04460 [Candidatus Microthrix sp.]|nr:hypothetical protein [Candidatus Microthrix sp.]MBK9558831.1 hypothetical protein [Candidatus Microthrix sp.]